MAQKKDTAVSIASRREMAELLASSREASARIRVENICRAWARIFAFRLTTSAWSVKQTLRSDLSEKK